MSAAEHPVPGASVTPTPSGRLASLDALRGIAAAVVLVHHALLTAPSIANVQLSGPRAAVGWQRLLVIVPFHLAWAGAEAVLVFFVLSGVVLALSMQRDILGWPAYYMRRLTRLYLPVWAAIGLAVLLATLFRWRGGDDLSWWLASHAHPLSWHALRVDSTLVSGTDWLDAPLWSLRWEVWFSLLLPLYLAVARPARRFWPVLAFGMAALIVVGSRDGHDSLRYLPIFGFGVLLGVQLDAMRAKAAGLPRARWWLFLALALLALDARWIQPVAVSPYALMISGLGAAGLVTIVALAPGAARLGSSSTLRWLGRVSFSLYLVHEPILVSVSQLPLPRPASALVLGGPLALLAAHYFHRYIERPAQQLASRLGGHGTGVSGSARTGSKPAVTHTG